MTSGPVQSALGPEPDRNRVELISSCPAQLQAPGLWSVGSVGGKYSG